MSALSHFLETEGLSTTGISLVREHTEAMAPPRALWVPFPLGRPLGVPGDPAFQHRVISAALALLDKSEGPVLEDFPEPAPENGSGEPWSCPVRFARAATGEDLAGAARAELAGLATWHALAVRRRGRTAAGTSGLAIEQCLDLVIDASEAGDSEDMRRLKAAVEDLKQHYVEAITARPRHPTGRRPRHDAVERVRARPASAAPRRARSRKRRCRDAVLRERVARPATIPTGTDRRNTASAKRVRGLTPSGVKRLWRRRCRHPRPVPNG